MAVLRAGVDVLIPAININELVFEIGPSYENQFRNYTKHRIRQSRVASHQLT